MRKQETKRKRSIADAANTTAVKQFPLWQQLLFSSLIFVAFFALLETVLWLAGTETRIQREDPFRGFSELVPIFVREGDVYTTRASIRRTAINPQTFAANKAPGGIRIFGLGGSSAYGYPWGAQAAFLSIVGDVVAAAHPDRKVEAINAAGMSYAMHRLRIVANELIDYEPDIFVIFAGHNEFIEPAFYAQLKHSDPVMNRLEWTLSHTHLYSALHGLLNEPGDIGESLIKRFDAHVDRDSTATYTESSKREIIEAFRGNLLQIVRLAHSHGASVVLTTVPCNLRDWAPNASIIETPLDPARSAELTETILAGKQYLENQQFRPAAQSFERGLKLAPAHAETSYRLAQAYDGLGDWDLARAAYANACDYDASPIRRLSSFNDIIREIAGQEGALLVDADRIFERESEHGLVGLNLIEDYVHPTQRGHRLIARNVWQAIDASGWLGPRSDASGAIFDRTVTSRPMVSGDDTPTWLSNQARLLAHRGKTAQAIEKFREALRLRPDYTLALYNLAVLLSRSGHADEAEPLLRRLLAIDADNFNGYNTLGTTLRRLKRPDEAIGAFRSATTIKPDFDIAWNNLANALYDLKRYDEAIETYRQALEINPHHTGIRTNLGSVLLESGRRDQAIAELQTSVRAAPESLAARQGLGEALLAAKDYAGAEQQLLIALRLKPDSATAHRLLANVLLQQSRVDSALQHLQRALEISPDDVEARTMLDSVLERQVQ